ncbi:hypothetical protein pb186bvf_010154 [Paramecium bursaria]
MFPSIKNKENLKPQRSRSIKEPKPTRRHITKTQQSEDDLIPRFNYDLELQKIQEYQNKNKLAYNEFLRIKLIQLNFLGQL